MGPGGAVWGKNHIKKSHETVPLKSGPQIVFIAKFLNSKKSHASVAF